MKKAATTKSPKLTRESILTRYMDDTLEGNDPGNIYLFSKKLGISESEFYRFFSSFDDIGRYFFELLFDKTMETIQKSADYGGYPPREKLLSFYYTFFGNLTQNRSFVLHLLPPNRFENIRKLKGLHGRFVAYVETLELDKPDMKSKRLNNVQGRAMQEGAWLQMMTIFKFWRHDHSEDFEKTDILIEKSVNAGFEIMNTRPLKSVLDLGKFLFKEVSPVI